MIAKRRSMAERRVFVTRPDGQSLWLSEETAKQIGVSHGDRLTPEQMNGPILADLLNRRAHARKEVPWV